MDATETGAAARPVVAARAADAMETGDAEETCEGADTGDAAETGDVAKTGDAAERGDAINHFPPFLSPIPHLHGNAPDILDIFLLLSNGSLTQKVKENSPDTHFWVIFLDTSK